MTVRIGINPITWTNDDVPELGGDTPLGRPASPKRGRRAMPAPSLAASFRASLPCCGRSWQRFGLAVISGWYDGRCAEKEVAAEMDAVADRICSS